MLGIKNLKLIKNMGRKLKPPPLLFIFTYRVVNHENSDNNDSTTKKKSNILFKLKTRKNCNNYSSEQFNKLI